jgi:hypothetical protein
MRCMIEMDPREKGKMKLSSALLPTLEATMQLLLHLACGRAKCQDFSQVLSLRHNQWALQLRRAAQGIVDRGANDSGHPPEVNRLALMAAKIAGKVAS